MHNIKDFRKNLETFKKKLMEKTKTYLMKILLKNTQSLILAFTAIYLYSFFLFFQL